MRTHSQVITDAGGVPGLRAKLSDVGVALPDATVRAWMRRPDEDGSIPPEYWPSLVRISASTLDELASAAEARKFPDANAA